MDTASRSELLAACRVIFNRELDAAFLERLRESGLKAAWRLKALDTHPDRAAGSKNGRRGCERFIAARSAYDLLREHLRRREAPRPPGPQRPARRHPQARTATPRHKPPAPIAAVPPRRLRLGEFLYHSRVISFGELAATLVCQRRQRERFCEVAVRWGYLSGAQADLLLARRLPLERTGEAAERLCLLTPRQTRLVLTFQCMRQEPLGSLFVRRGLLSHRRLQELLGRLSDHNSSVRAG
jgi:hypothetical protein